ncbi:hypothetical protein VTN77DRAFT_5876 [Rasamsonia byssochlamydoides]|uniref:uncharacterized protein n=1 Tax=Rasamsonia byssochlamydoides TaxID=89139 RepID=UPI0037440318
MFALEQQQPASKRRRLTESLSHNHDGNVNVNEPPDWEDDEPRGSQQQQQQQQQLVPPPPLSTGTCQWSPLADSNHQFRQHHSPLSSTSSWYMYGQDGFSHNPGYLASQEELRYMLFTIAQSAAPTRAGSPASLQEEEDRGRHDGSGDQTQIPSRVVKSSMVAALEQ